MVRATARSQSLPTAYTADPAADVVRLTDGAPIAPPTFTAPTPATPLKATTVSDWCTPVAACVLETVTLVSTAAAEAVQISASPNCVAARARRVHVRPAPLIVSVWLFGAAGPSEAAKATSVSPAAVVLNAAVVRLPRPSEKTILSTVGTANGRGPLETTIDTALDGATVAPPIGVWLMIAPAATVALLAVVTAPSVSPAPVIAAWPSSWRSPTTFGTLTSAGPSDSVNATALFGATDAPTPGFCPTTCPTGAAAFTLLIVPTVRAAAMMAACALGCVNPMIAGTVAKFRTVTVTGVDVAVLPAASRATAVSV